jgi:hypothetical protein
MPGLPMLDSVQPGEQPRLRARRRRKPGLDLGRLEPPKHPQQAAALAADDPEDAQAMSAMGAYRVDYAQSARRHFHDAEQLLASHRHGNAGHLFGFAAESGLKAVLVACGVPTDADGGIPRGHRLREHVPVLGDRLLTDGHLVPDGRFATVCLARVSSLGNLHDWSIDHRYWADAALPIASLHRWRQCANEIMAMLDQAREDGVLR